AAESMQRLLEHWQVLMAGIVADPQQRLSHLPLLSTAEHQQLLHDYNQTAVVLPVKRSIHECFAEQARRTPDAVAVVDEHQQVSYGELNRRANQLGHYLQGLGVGPEQVVGVCLRRSVAMVIG